MTGAVGAVLNTAVSGGSFVLNTALSGVEKGVGTIGTILGSPRGAPSPSNGGGGSSAKIPNTKEEHPDDVAMRLIVNLKGCLFKLNEEKNVDTFFSA